MAAILSLWRRRRYEKERYLTNDFYTCITTSSRDLPIDQFSVNQTRMMNIATTKSMCCRKMMADRQEGGCIRSELFPEPSTSKLGLIRTRCSALPRLMIGLYTEVPVEAQRCNRDNIAATLCGTCLGLLYSMLVCRVGKPNLNSVSDYLSDNDDLI